MQCYQLCRSLAKPGLHGLLKLFDPSNPSTYQICVMIFFLLRFSKFRSPVTTLQSYLETFTSTLSSLLDKHAPLKNISCSSKTLKPFITPDIRSEKVKRSYLKTIYQRSRRPSDFQNFRKQSIVVHKFISDSRRSYYRSLILARRLST